VTDGELCLDVPVVQRFDLRWSLVAAGLGGAALATKLSVGVLGIPIIVKDNINTTGMPTTAGSSERCWCCSP
jgi:Asp-tRNA(Asn)/Glu-tRNA(Gln) amidotransferase A subunit family amidase